MKRKVCESLFAVTLALIVAVTNIPVTAFATEINQSARQEQTTENTQNGNESSGEESGNQGQQSGGLQEKQGAQNETNSENGQNSTDNPAGAGQKRLCEHAHHVLFRQVCLGILWPVPGCGRFCAGVRRSEKLSDGSPQCTGGAAGGRTGRAGGCRYFDGKAGHGVSGCAAVAEGKVSPACGAVQRQW